jgi:hypothetical protein
MLKFLDFLGPNISLNINQSSNFKSSIGGLMTILISIVFLIVFFGFGNDIFYKRKPRVTFNRVINDRVPYHEFKDDNFLFTFYNQYTDRQFEDFERMFTVYYDYFNFMGDGKIEVSLRNPFEKCNKNSIKKWASYFRYDAETYYCFPKNSTIPISGTRASGIFKGLRLQLDFCTNNTDPKKGQIKTDCFSQDNIKKLISTDRIQVHYLLGDNLVNIFDYETPFLNLPKEGNMNTDANSWSRVSFAFKEIRVNTDTGYLTTNVMESKAISIDSTENEFFYTPGTTTLISNLFFFSYWVENYNREYIKVQDVIAMMGGFVSFSLIVIKYVLAFITRPQIIDIFNSIYLYKNLKSSKNTTKSRSDEYKEKKLKMKDMKKTNLNNDYVFISSPSSQNFEKRKQPQLEYIKEKDFTKNFSFQNKFGFCRSVIPFCTFPRKFKKHFLDIEKKMKNAISFESIIKVKKNQKLVNFLLFENYQRNIFKYCSIPQIKKPENIFNAFTNEIQIECINQIDSKILKSLKYSC